MNAALYPGAEDASPRPIVPRIGKGTLLTVTSAGYSISVPSRKGRYPHPFKPALGSLTVSFSRGLVEGFEPKIKGKPISGGPGIAPPLLKLDPAVANAAGESWCCIEVEPNDAGQVDEKSRVEMVHTASRGSLDPKVARFPVVLILWRNKRPFFTHEIAYFNVRYRRIPQRDGPPYHLFF
jgi:hypothetical protein